MNIFDIIKLSYSNLLLNKVRTFFTMLGVIMGIASVVLISSLGQGFQVKIISEIDNIAKNFIEIGINNNSKKKLVRKEYFDDYDLNYIKTINNVRDVTLFYADFEADEGRYVQIVGFNKEDFKYWQTELLLGRYFTEEEYNDPNTNSIMIDSLTYQKEYLEKGIVNPIGLKYKLKSNNKLKEYLIVGVFKNPAEYLFKISSGNSTISSFRVPKIIYSSRDTKKLYKNLLVVVKDSKDISSTIKSINDYLKTKTDREIYKIEASSKNVDQFNKILSLVTVMISLIAAISLVVGGIGVMNIMLISVTERITEIGLRKALGAKNKDIKRQFLIESAAITLVGGVIGIILGYLLAIAISIPLQIRPILTIKILIVSVIVSIVTGIFFGMYPANKASKLMPMEALRKE